MPASRLQERAILTVRRFDVLGIDADSSAGFVRHVGLAADESLSFDSGSMPEMIHMGPPFGTAAPTGPITCVGTAGLTADEILTMELFVERIGAEYEASGIRDARRQYCIAPHVRPYYDEGTVVCSQFNCVGFVIEAYRFANIDLLATEPCALPLIQLDVLARQYPRVEGALRNLRFREQMGIPGDGPWPVVLAGYVLNALARSEEEIRSEPYNASAGDEFFPPLASKRSPTSD
jgi:hypothetical protein